MTLKPYFQLVRLPNLFTAAADSLAGWLLTGGELGSFGAWVPLCLASVSTYAGGVVLNDVFDLEVDRDERPNRPLPSRRVSVRFATTLGIGLLALGLAFAAFSGTHYGLRVESILIATVLAYDVGLKRTLLGPEVMGACRGLNLLLGMSGSPGIGGPVGWGIAGSYAAFVTGITWISRSEVRPGAGINPGIATGVGLQNLAVLGILAAALRLEVVSPSTQNQDDGWGGGLALLVGVGVFVNWRSIHALLTPTDRTVQLAVKAGIFSLIWLHVGLLVATRGATAGLAVAWLWVPAFWAGRWVYST